MCGINGFTFPDKTKIHAMNERLKHRGPDDQGIYVADRVSLGNTRLAIIDLSLRGHQPMVDRDERFVITFNGEIYNFKELREELLTKDYTFRSETDTEVILNLYKEYAEKAFSLLNGMFAIAIWDSKERKLILVRDRVGIKPLYYAIHDGNLFFSSEIKALFVHRIPKSINRQALDLYLRLLYVPAPLTMFAGISKVIPGELLTWKNSKLTKKYFWKPQLGINVKLTKSQVKHKIRDTLTNAVRLQLVSDRPVGIFLSGGMDSTTILGLATQIHSSPMKTFSIGFSGVGQLEKFNADFLLARKSARFFHADHHEYLLSPPEALSYFQKLVATLDEPIANPTHIPTFALAKEARKEVVVALGGDGGDELFGGYDSYLDAWLLDLYQSLPLALRKLALPLIKKLKRSAPRSFFEGLEAKTSPRKYLTFMGREEEEIQKIYPSDLEETSRGLAKLRGFEVKKIRFHQLLPLLDFMHWLPEESLMRTDKMTMHWSLEQRVPFLDNQVIDLAFQIPFSWKVGWRFRKKILRETFSDFLPEAVLTAPKRGFFSPGAKWLRDKNWKPFVAEMLSENRSKRGGIFNAKEVGKMLADHISGMRYNLHLLWALLTFESWYKQNFE